MHSMPPPQQKYPCKVMQQKNQVTYAGFFGRAMMLKIIMGK